MLLALAIVPAFGGLAKTQTNQPSAASRPSGEPEKTRSCPMATSPLGEQYDHDDPSLKTGAEGLTVWNLQKMALEKRFNELNNFFDNGLTMKALPTGYSAGAGIGLLAGENKLIAEWLDSLAEKNWRGKIYFSSSDKSASEGRNRFRKSFLNRNSPFIPMLKFKTMLLDSHPLAPRAKSNLVVLNYSDPLTKPYVQELLVTKIHGFDAMVAVRGKYGPVFVGKTWLGKYDKKGKFTASDPNKLAGWYFLDFNAEAVKEQRESHWDGSEEEMLDPIPHIDHVISQAA